jgi:tetratricopeptide (TPR) repeat protein
MQSTEEEKSGSLELALLQCAKLLQSRPDLAAEQAREILKVVPKHPEAELLLGRALRSSGNLEPARNVLLQLAQSQPKAASVHCELGLVFGALGDSPNALKALGYATKLDPKNATAWRALADEKALAGDTAGADTAYAESIKASVNEPRLIEAATALADNKLAISERILRPYLKEHPTDVAAMRMLAELGARLERYDEAEKLLARSLELSPSFVAARHNYAGVLFRQNKPERALEEIAILRSSDPRNPSYRVLQSAALAHLGEHEKARKSYGDLLREYPHQPRSWMSYGHVLKTLGRTNEGIDAYRKAITLMPSLGEAYWSLANLKTFRFDETEIAAMRAQLERNDLKDDDRFHLEFALGKALEDLDDYSAAFEHYEKGNLLRRKSLPYDAGQTSGDTERLREVFTPGLFARFGRLGNSSTDPIFVVGLPRSGSTLIEQILASHSQVEGTMELHDIGDLSRELGGWRGRKSDTAYPESIAKLSDEKLGQLGNEYIARTRKYRKLGKRFFIDKMPNNFLHIGLIHLILPNAKIIDARRHPLGCALSCFKQHFARGQAFSYSLTDIGRYYADYVRLMAHFDLVLPGAVHRVFYENMVGDPEAEVRKLLDYCGLPFEEDCLNFHQNDRAVRTASSEQVRQPIFTSGMDQWQHFEPWLGPLKSSLGEVLLRYPDVPTF